MPSEPRIDINQRTPIAMMDSEESRHGELTEETSLLDAGARNQGGPDNNNGTGKPGWEGYDDFMGLPWWKTPTVRSESHNPSQANPTKQKHRCIGWSHRICYSHSPLGV